MIEIPVEMLSDADLAVECELVGICLFGFDTYKHENNARAEKLRRRLDELDAAFKARGLTDAHRAAAETDSRVVALSERNRKFIQARF